MKCQICGTHSATTHVTKRINGQTSEWHLCAECAAKHGVGVPQAGGLSIDSLFGGLLTQPFLRESDPTTVCPVCNMSFRQIVAQGSVGCPTCYTTFYDRLRPSIQRVHGKTSHIGKTASAGSDEVRRQREIETLKSELERALAAQEYERCAELRDRIKLLEEGHS